jgi:hypothetical protein
MSHFYGPCPRCGDLLTEYTRRCPACGALTGLSPLPRVRRAAPVEHVEPRPVETTSTRYVVRECEGYRIAPTIKRLAYHALPGVECVVLDTAWNHRRVVSFSSEQYGPKLGRARMIAAAREDAATRCDLLNALDEIGRGAQGAVA